MPETSQKQTQICFWYTWLFFHGFIWHDREVTFWTTLPLHSSLSWQTNKPNLPSVSCPSSHLWLCLYLNGQLGTGLWSSYVQLTAHHPLMVSFFLECGLTTWTYNWNSIPSSWVALDCESFFFIYLLFIFSLLVDSEWLLCRPYIPLDFLEMLELN